MLTRQPTSRLVLVAVLSTVIVGTISCDGPVLAQAEQRTANFIFTSPAETDRLQVSYPRGSRVWNGFLEISARGNTKRIPVSGEVNTEGVPVTITIPSSQVGAADVEFGMFYDSDLNLQLVGNNNIPHPRLMKRVK